MLSGQDVSLPFGVRALAMRKNKLPLKIPFLCGGGTARLIGLNWVVCAKAPERFEAGTPAVINIILFVKVLLLIKEYGKDILNSIKREKPGISEVFHEDELSD